MIRPTAIGLVTAITLTLAPAAAQALTISSAGGTITVQAAAGEGNAISVAVSAANWRFTDFGDNLNGTPIVATAGPGCVAAAPSVDCPMAGVTNAVVNLLDRSDILSLNLFVGVAVNADGGELGDQIFTAGGNDTVSGGGGGDRIFAGAGNDALNGGPGADQIFGESADGEAGNDTIDGGSGEDQLFGDTQDGVGSGNDTVTGGEDNDQLFMDAGNDTLSGGAGVDTVFSGFFEAANFTISLDDAANDTSTATGTDNVRADIENVNFGEGNDTVAGSADSNIIQTGAGDDTVDAGDGNDTVNTGTGTDALAAGGGDDNVAGGAGGDVVGGGAGDDFVDGDDGTDQISGNDGTDTLVPDLGSDVVSGGAGTDTVNFTPFGISASLDNVANDGQPGDNQNLLSDVENINGSGGNDTLTGGPGFNVINGNAGDDDINVRDGAGDLVLCAAGFDVVTADGADTIDGSTGPCEATDFGDLTGFGPVVGVAFAKHAGKAAKATLTCPFVTNGFCQGTIKLKAGKKSAGSATFFLEPGQSEVESIDLSRTARNTLEEKGKLKVTATINASDGRGATSTGNQKATLKA